MKKRVKYCDVLRVIAIILVIMIHVLAEYRDYYLLTNKTYYLLISFVDSFTRAAVPIFFMITGAFMLSNKGKESYKDFIKKRVPKLVIPLVIISIVYYIWDRVGNNLPLSLLEFFQDFTSVGGVKYHLWFMYVIILIYLFIPYLKVLIQNITKKDLLRLIIMIFVLGNVLFTINLYTAKFDVEMFSSLSLSRLMKYANYLFLGYYLYTYDIKKTTRKKIYLLGIISLIVLPFADYMYIDNMRNDVMYTAETIFPIFIGISLFLLVKYNYDKIKLFEKLEPYTAKVVPVVFYIYMIHVLVMDQVKKIMLQIYNPTRLIENLVFIPLLIIITFIVSYVIAIILNKLYNFCERKIINRKSQTKEKITE